MHLVAGQCMFSTAFKAISCMQQSAAALLCAWPAAVSATARGMLESVMSLVYAWLGDPQAPQADRSLGKG